MTKRSKARPYTQYALSDAEERRHDIYAKTFVSFATTLSVTLLVLVSLGVPDFELDLKYSGEPVGTWEVVNETPDELNGKDVQALVRNDLVYLQIKGESKSSSQIESIQKEDEEIRVYTKPEKDTNESTRVYALTLRDVDLDELPKISQVNSRGIVAEAVIVSDQTESKQ